MYRRVVLIQLTSTLQFAGILTGHMGVPRAMNARLVMIRV